MSPALISRYTVMVETRINSATSATVRNRAFAWDSTLASLLRACGHSTPLWLLWPVSNEANEALRLAELLGALGGFPYCLDERASDTAALEGAQPGGRRAARRRHGGAVLLGGLARLGQQAGRPEHGLDHQGVGRGPWQARQHAGFDQRFGDEEHVGRARTGQPGDGVEQGFAHALDDADGAEDALGPRQLVLARPGAGGDGRRAGADEGGGVRHGPHDRRAVADPPLELGQGDAGGYRQHALHAGLGDAATRALHVVGLDGDDGAVTRDRLRRDVDVDERGRQLLAARLDGLDDDDP